MVSVRRVATVGITLASVAAPTAVSPVALACALLAAVPMFALAAGTLAEGRIARVGVVGGLAALASHPARDSLLAVAPALAPGMRGSLVVAGSPSLLAALAVLSVCVPAGVLASSFASASATFGSPTAALLGSGVGLLGHSFVVSVALVVGVAVVVMMVVVMVLVAAFAAVVVELRPILMVALSAFVKAAFVGLLAPTLFLVRICHE